MHRCLNVDEIVRLIACELITSGRKATAVCLACCCKGFQNPVLDELWATQVSLFPLFKCFPEDVWNEGGHTTFKRLPTATEWARFRKYARRMRELSERDTPRILSFEVYSAMQLYPINGPLLPNLTTLDLWAVGKLFIPVIPLLLSPTITSISFAFCVPLPPKSMVASVVTSLPILCPNLQDIHLLSLPKDPIITAAVSRMVLAPNRNALRKFRADSPLTEEAREAISKSQNLRNLSVVIEKGTSIPSASLPNLTYLKIECEDGSGGLQLLRGATFGELESVNFYFRSKPVGGFLKAFKDAALSSTIQNTLFVIHFFTGWSWYPDYSSLLPFTRLVHLTIWSTCDENCSNVDDNIIIDLSRVMPELEFLQLGDAPCRQFAGGVTARGLVALAENCLGLSSLVVHFQVATLSDPPTCLGTICSAEHSASWTDCALMDLEVGNIPVPESISMVALTLLRIFPRIETISSSGGAWDEVEDVIRRSKGIIDCSRASLTTNN